MLPLPQMSLHARSKTVARPMATARHVGLFSREIIERLSLAGVEMLLSRVSKLSEGQAQPDGRYYGSTMLTLDVRELESIVRDACDVSTAKRLVRLLSGNETAAERIRVLAHAEATRVAGHPLLPGGIDVRLRSEGSWLFIDIDVEATLDAEPKSAVNFADRDR
jgi:hypothetical protein